MTYRFLEDVALADIAFEARAPSLPGLFEESAIAMTEAMVDRRTLKPKMQKVLEVASVDRERLLYDFLTELIILKDVDSLLFKNFKVTLNRDARKLRCVMKGEQIQRERHALRNDVKAVTMHLFCIKRSKNGWTSTIVLDI